MPSKGYWASQKSVNIISLLVVRALLERGCRTRADYGETRHAGDDGADSRFLTRTSSFGDGDPMKGELRGRIEFGQARRAEGLA